MATNIGSESVESLSNLERLILAQAVYEFGLNKWNDVSTTLSKHPLLHRPKNYYTAEYCNEIFLALMKDANLELPEPERSRKAPAVLRLAQTHYTKRVQEIRALLDEEEAKFRKLAGEIDLIRSGKWDDRIRADLTGEPLPLQAPEPPAEFPVESADSEPAKAPSPTTTTSDELPNSSQIVEQMLADHTISLTTAEETREVPKIVQETKEESPQAFEHPEDQEPQPEAHVAAPLDETQAIPTEESIPEEPVKAVSRPPSAEPMEVVEEQPAAEAPAEQPPEEEAAMDVDTAPPPEATPPPPPESAKSVPTPTDQDVEMVATPKVPPSHEGKRKTSEALSEPPRERKRLREESEQPDEEEQGPSSATKGRRKAQGGDKKFQNVIGMLHSTISQHRYGNIFHNPIKRSEAADYADLVKRPMDLKTIKARVKDGITSNSLEFQRDVYLMFANAMMYNRPGSEIYAMAEEMMLESEIQINNFRQTEGFHHK